MKLKTPFNMIILRKTGCGKTYYLLKMLEKEYKDHFQYIVLICPTYDYNLTYENWEYKWDEKFIVLCCDQDETDYCLQYAIEFLKGTNSLVIMDDCVKRCKS